MISVSIIHPHAEVSLHFDPSNPSIPSINESYPMMMDLPGIHEAFTKEKMEEKRADARLHFP